MRDCEVAGYYGTACGRQQGKQVSRINYLYFRLFLIVHFSLLLILHLILSCSFLFAHRFAISFPTIFDILAPRFPATFDFVKYCALSTGAFWGVTSAGVGKRD